MKRVLSLFLALVLSLSTLTPLTVMAAPGEATGSPFTNINLSGVGMNIGAADWANGEWAVEAAELGEELRMEPEGLKTRLMVRAMDLDRSHQEEGFTPELYALSGDDSWHELTLYSHQDLDPAAITLDGVTVSSEGFRESVYGNNTADTTGTLYRYVAKVQLPAADGAVGIWYGGEKQDELSLYHVRGTSPVPLVTTMWVEDYEEVIVTDPETGEDVSYISSMTLRISGFSLPETASGYAIPRDNPAYDPEKGNSDDNPMQIPFAASAVTAPDEYGYRLVTFTFGGDTQGMDLIWSDIHFLIANGDATDEITAFFFGPGSHTVGGGETVLTFRTDYSLGNDLYWGLGGVNVTVPTPYYCISKPAPTKGEAPAVKPELVIIGATRRGDGMLCTQDPSVDVYEKAGSYDGGQWRLSFDGVYWHEWYTAFANEGGTNARSAAPFASYGDYGDYTIYAQFRKEGLRNTTVSYNINYNNGLAPAPANARILDAKTGTVLTPNDQGRYYITGDADRQFLIVADGYPEMEMKLGFMEYDQERGSYYDPQEAGTLTYQARTKRYEIKVKKSDIPDGDCKLALWTETAEGYVYPSCYRGDKAAEYVELPLFNMEPTLFRPMAPNYAAQRRVDDAGNAYEAVKPGDEIELLFTASTGGGWSQEVKMTYTDMSGVVKTLTATPTRYGDSKNSFRAVFTIPADAKQLGTVTCTLLSDGAAVETATYDLSACRVVADVTLTGIPAGYKGVRLTLTKDLARRTVVFDGATSLSFGDLTPGTYQWELEGKSGHIAKGEFNVTRGAALTLPDLPSLGSVTVNTVGFQNGKIGDRDRPEATVTLKLTTPDGVAQTITAAPGAKVEELPVGTTGTVELTWDTATYEEVSGYTPAAPTVTVNGDETVTLTFRPFTMRTISGKLYGQKAGVSSWFKPWGAVIVLTQQVTRGGKTETYTRTAGVSASDGKSFSIQCYDNIPATLEFRSLTWSGDPVTVTDSGDKNLGNVFLTDGNEKLIQVKVQGALPASVRVDSEGKVHNESTASDPVPLDSAFLQISKIYNGQSYYGNDFFETFTVDGQLWVKIKEGVVSGNGVIDITALGTQEYGGLTYRVQSGYSWIPQSARASELGSGAAAVTYTAAMTGGELRATVVDDPDSGMTGFLMYFYETAIGSVTCRYVCGTGELHLPYDVFSCGERTVMSLMVRDEDVSAMADVLRSSPDSILNQIPKNNVEKLVMRTSSTKKYCFREKVNLSSNTYVYVDDMVPNVNVGAEILPPYSFRYDVSLTDDASHLLVTGTLTKRFPDVINGDAIKKLQVLVLNPTTGEAGADATDSVAVNGKYGYNGYFTSFTYHDDVIQFKAPLTNYNDLRFKVVLNIGTPGATMRDRTITFAYDDAIPIFSLSGPTNVYIADQVNAQGLSEAAIDPHRAAANWTLRLSLRSSGARNDSGLVTLWDNGVSIWAGNIGCSSYFWPIDVRLTDNLTPGIHVLWATRTLNGQEIATDPLVINLMSGSESKSVHVSDLTWVHYNSRTSTSSEDGDVMHFKNLSELGGQTIWLWPGKRTDMSFRVNNATTKELKGVSVRFYGVRVRGRNLDNITATIPCSCTYESQAGNYSLWEFKNAHMGYFYNFEFVFDYQPAALSELSHESTDEERRIADLEATYEACGLGEVPDDTKMVDALKTMTKDQLKESLGESSEYLPDDLTGLNLQVTKNTATTYEVKLKQATEAIKDYRLTVTDGGEVPSHEVYALMELERAEGNQDPNEQGWQVCWAELDGIQGSTMIRMAVQNEKQPDGTYNLTMHRTAYITAEVADAIQGGTSLAVASANRTPSAAAFAETSASRTPGAAQTGLYDGGDPPAHWIKNRYDETSFLHSTADITQDIYVAAVKGTYSNPIQAAIEGDKAKFIPKGLSDTMNVLGVADAAISISSGPSGKDSMGLYMLLSNVKDQKFRTSIERQLQDYDQLRMDIYAQDTAISAISAGANFVPDPSPLTKIVVFLGGLGNSTISGWSKDYNRQVYNTTLLDIQRQIRFEKYKEMRAEMDQQFKEMVARRFGSDVANNERLLREEKKHWVLSTDEFGDPKWRLRENVPEYNTYQDPSGYVFEAVEESRIEGVTATLYYSDEADGTYTVWQDPAANPQSNPQSTTSEGRYQWMVPEGWWKVRYEKDGYLVSESKPMEVPPVHTTVNIGLLSTQAPTAAVKETDGSYSVAFSQYMQVESLVKNAADYGADSFDAASFAIRFLDENGDPVPGTVTFPDKTANTGYRENGTYNTDVIPSDWFARNAVFTPDAGHTVKTWSLGKGMVSYAGVALDGETENLWLIHLDTNGGELSVQDMITGTDGKLTRLPDPYREGYRFLGWTDGSGNSVTLDTVFTADTTLKAHWEPFGGYTVEAARNEGEALTVTFKNDTAETAPVICLTAVYSAEGRMLRVASVKLTTGTTSSTPATDDGTSLRAFCYDADAVPVTQAFYLRLAS